MLNSINTPLLDLILSEDFLESIVYVGETEKYSIVAKFLCEFLGMIKNLPMDTKAEVCKTFKTHSIGTMSLIFLQGLFKEHFEDHQLQKNMILSHMELLFFAFRKDMDYCRDCFTKTSSSDLIEHILLFADASTYAYFA
jgi:hypothetical protein